MLIMHKSRKSLTKRKKKKLKCPFQVWSNILIDRAKSENNNVKLSCHFYHAADIDRNMNE